jgi:hypothetical protein
MDLYRLLSGLGSGERVFSAHLSSIACSPKEEGGQQFYRACGAVDGTARVVTLGLDKEFDFGGCGGGI